MSLLLKVIMVGSGGVGKSALTLQFMYDEVSSTFCLVSKFYIVDNADRKLILVAKKFQISNLISRSFNSTNAVRGRL